MPHDLGDWLGCYDHPSVRSPRLDQFASQGVQFKHYFAAAPECTPSRACTFTGLHCHQNGLMGLSNFGWSLRPGVKHLAALLADAGYRTHLWGTQHETSADPCTLGYRHVNTGKQDVDSVCGKVADFLQSDDSKRDGPWFIHAGFRNVHRPWKPAVSTDPTRMTPPPWLPDTPAVRQDLADFHDDITRMDAAIGGVLDALDRSGQAEHTIVIFTSDHGLPFPRAKATLYDPGLRIPLLARWPGGFAGGRACPQLLSNVDLTPTVLDLCGIESPAGLAGRTFAPLLRGQPYVEHDAIFATLYYDVAYDPMHMVRTREHKYLRSFAVTAEDRTGVDAGVLATHPAGRWIRVDDYDVLSSAAWRSLSVDCSPPPPEELYDLGRDPLEQDDLATRPDAQELLDAMRDRLRKWMEATQSPLLSGHVAPNDKQCEAAEQYRYGGPMYARLR